MRNTRKVKLTLGKANKIRELYKTGKYTIYFINYKQ